MDGAIIIFSVVVIVLIASINNYQKEIQFRKLMELREERQVLVKRNGDVIAKNSKKLVVGDVILVNQGDKLPADCILIEGTGLILDESSQTGESEATEKSVITMSDSKSFKNANPFLLSGTIVKEGRGEAVVCAVGPNTRMGKIEEMLQEQSEPSPLQEKLEGIVKCIFFKFGHSKKKWFAFMLLLCVPS